MLNPDHNIAISRTQSIIRILSLEVFLAVIKIPSRTRENFLRPGTSLAMNILVLRSIDWHPAIKFNMCDRGPGVVLPEPRLILSPPIK